ncbi:MAG: hypothetical protein ISS63_15520 [Desulfobacteraceae bacterium]|nr:hypothetical protein [Desulfobacteraceae bacterium]
MKKIPLLLITVLLLFPPANAAVFQTKPLPEQFQELVKHLGEYLESQKGFKLEKDENIKDVATFGYMNALNRAQKPFLSLDDAVKKEMVRYLSTFCWLPIYPPAKKEPVKKELRKLRKALSTNLYESTLASMCIAPGFAVTSFAQVRPNEQLTQDYSVYMSTFPYSWPQQMVGPRSKDIELWLGKKKWEYGYLFNKEWVNKYLP